MGQAIDIYSLYADETDKGKRYFSPWCWASTFAIRHKGFPVHILPWEFGEHDKIAFSGQGKVPVIVDRNNDGKWVNDSFKIARYLEETYPDRPTLFGGPAGEAAAFFVQNWWQDSVADCFMQLTLFDIYHALPARHQPWFRETRQGWVNATFEEYCANDGNRAEVLASFRGALEPLRALLKEYEWLGGPEGPTYVDMFVMAWFMTAYAVCPTKLLEESDPLHAWRNKMYRTFADVIEKAVGHPESL